MGTVVPINDKARFWNEQADKPIPYEEGITLANAFISLCQEYDHEGANLLPIYIALGVVLSRLVMAMEQPDPTAAIKMTDYFMRELLELQEEMA